MATQEITSELVDFVDSVGDITSLADSIDEMKEYYVATHAKIGLSLYITEDLPVINELCRMLRRIRALESAAIVGTPHA